MLVSGFGVLVAATLLAVAPIYSTAMSDLGLSYRLSRELPEAADRLTYLSAPDLRFGSAKDRAAVEAMDIVTAARVGWLGDGVLTESRSSRFDIEFRDFDSPSEPVEVPEGLAEPVRQVWGGFLYDLGDWESHVDLVEGRLPSEEGDPEVVLPDGFQRHAAVGDVLRLTAASFNDCPNVPRSQDPDEAAAEVPCEPTGRLSTRLDVTIVGFVRPHEPTADRWLLFEGEWTAPDIPLIPRLRLVGSADPRRTLMNRGVGQMPLLTTGEQFDGVFRAAIPEFAMRHRAGLLVDTAQLNLADVPYAVADLTAWRDDVQNRLELVGLSRLDILPTLEEFQTAQSFTAVPLLVVMLQVVGIVFYYVVIVMAMLLERQKQEIGVYRSRGSTSTQLIGLSFVEGMALAVPALIVAPFFAAVVVSALGLTPSFSSITDGALLPVKITPESYLLAVGGSVLSLLAILLPALVAVRRGIIDVKREESRPAERNVLQRYYLDFAFVGIAVLLMWQLNQQGSVFDPGTVGGWGSDPLLLAAPFVLTVAVSLMMLRLYPPLVRFVVRLLLTSRGTATAIGLRRAGRAPAAYARVMLLIIMAVAVGTFAASYGPTVGQSYEDRALYTAGMDLRGRLSSPGDRQLADRIAALNAHEDVMRAGGAYRGLIHTASGFGVPVLAVDPDLVTGALWWRDDFAAEPLDTLMREIRSEASVPPGYVIPEGARRLQIAANATDPSRFTLLARFRHEDGRYSQGVMRSEDATPGEWSTWSTSIPQSAGTLRFAGFKLVDRMGGALRLDGSVLFDDLSTVTGNGQSTLLEGFEGAQRWMMLTTRDSSEEFTVARSGTSPGAQVIEWKWTAQIQPRTRALLPMTPSLPLVALMSPAAMDAFGTQPGGLTVASFEGIAVPIVVRGTVDLFPTLDPAAGMVVVNQSDLREVAAFLDYAPYTLPSELWLTFTQPLSPSEQLELALQLESGALEPRLDPQWNLRSRDVEGATSDPTLQAAGSGILAIAFVAVIGLSTVGFVATMTLGAHQRATEFAVLRAVGVSRWEVLRALALEWGVVLVIGVGVGALLGRRVANVMLGFLNVTEDGAAVVPPFVLQTSWQMLAFGLVVLSGAVVVSLLVAWTVAMRRSPTVELRLTQ